MNTIYRVSLKMGPSHNQGVENGSKRTKNSYTIILAIVFELKKEMSKSICD